MRLVLLEEPLGRLRRRQRTACRILKLHFESITIDPGLVELLERKLNTLLVLYAEIGPGAGHREQPARS